MCMCLRRNVLLWIAVSFGPWWPTAASELRMQDLEQRVESLERALREAARPHAEIMSRHKVPPLRSMETLPRDAARLPGSGGIDPRRDRPGLLRRAPAKSSPLKSAVLLPVKEWPHRAAPERGIWHRFPTRASGVEAAGQARLVANAPVVRIGAVGPSMEEVLESVTLEDVNRFVFRRNRADDEAMEAVRAGGNAR